MAKRVRRIGIIGYEGVQGLDIAGPVDAFSAANQIAAEHAPPYEITILAPSKRPFTTESGMILVPHERLEDAALLDTVIVPGGRGVRVQPKTRAAIAAWLKKHTGAIRRVASVCTGIYALAEAGILDGKKATTHWRFGADVAAKWPKVDVNCDAIFLREGNVYTSAGITAGIDLALALIEDDLGNDVALAVARELVVYLKRSGGQLQYSEPLQMQSKAGSKFEDVLSWMLDDLSADLSVEVLAERAELSPRHFSRKFKAAFGATPADFVEGLRLDHARWLLANKAASIETLAATVGYTNDDTFRRAFARRFGTVPSHYRRRFSADVKAD